MDGIANVARQQQSQVSNKEMQAEVSQTHVAQASKPQKVDLVEQMQQEVSQSGKEITTRGEVENLVQQLNEALAPISTNLKFGVDSDDIFFVSVIESKSNEMIRRFPVEQAANFLPKMQEVTGILFDLKG